MELGTRTSNRSTLSGQDGGDVTEATEDEWTNLWSVNVVGLARATKAALPYLKASSNGAIVNTASIVAAIGVPNRAVYAATKGAVVSLTYAMAADFAEFGIRVNAVAPGTADPPWVGRLLDAAADPEAERSALEARQPSGRLVRADEVARHCVPCSSLVRIDQWDPPLR